MEQLKFDRPSFKEGLNVTVRLGTKWANLCRNNFLEDTLPVELATTNGEVIGKARIEEVFVGAFMAMEPYLLELEHDHECRTIDGLYKAMKKVYGDSFNAGSEVSVIVFTVQELTKFSQ